MNAVTGYADELQGRLMSKLADAAIVNKPIKPDEFSAAVRKALGKK